MRPEAIKNTAHFYDRSGEADLFAENLRAIRGREDGLADIEPNFAAINIKCGYDFNVPRPIRTDLAMHQTDPIAIGNGAPIKVNSLNQRAGAVSNSNDGDPDLSHGRRRKTTQTEALGARVEFRNFTKGESTAPQKNQRISRKWAIFLTGNFIEKITTA